MSMVIKLLLAKEVNFHPEIYVNTQYQYIPPIYAKKSRILQLTMAEWTEAAGGCIISMNSNCGFPIRVTRIWEAKVIVGKGAHVPR